MKVIGKLKPIKDNVIITDMNFEEQVTATGIIIQSDDGKLEGIKPRWGKVYAVGPTQQDIKAGDWILVEHGRWTRGATIEGENGEEISIRRVDNKAILATAPERPRDTQLGASVMPDTRPEYDFSSPSF